MPKYESQLLCVAETARMIAGNPANGTPEDPIHMSTKDAENTSVDDGAQVDDDGIVTDVRRYLDDLPVVEGSSACIDEGRAIAGIVEPLGLPQKILAAVYAYPLYRDDILKSNSLQNKALKPISRFIIGLQQLDQFSLPDHWQPAERSHRPAGHR